MFQAKGNAIQNIFPSGFIAHYHHLWLRARIEWKKDFFFRTKKNFVNPKSISVFIVQFLDYFLYKEQFSGKRSDGKWNYRSEKKIFLKYSKTWANDHLWKVNTTCLQRLPFQRSNFKLHKTPFPLNKNHLSTTVKIFGSQGWSLYTGLTVFENIDWLYCLGDK